MNRTTKLGLLVVAALAMASMVTASASAAKLTASATGLPLTEETKSNHVFSVTGQSTSCNEVNINGETEAKETERLAVEVGYAGCTAFGFVNATVTNTNCTVTWWILFTIKERKIPNEPCLTLIKASAFGSECEVAVSGEQERTSLSWTDNSGHVTVKFNVTGIEAEVKKDNGLCPLGGTGKHSNATYTGESTIKASGGTLGFDP